MPLLAAAGILAIAVLVAAMDVPRLLRKKLHKELWIFAILLVFGTALSMAQALHLKIPNPADWIAAVYKPVSDMVSTLLK
jgi:NhaP-type Na+/H+ or K+/H+ antiporter